MVAGDGGHGVPGGLEAHQCLAEHHHCLGGCDRPVVQVAGDDDKINALVAAQLDQPFDERLLVVGKRDRPEAAAEVPVAGVEDAHEVNP